MKNKTVFNKSMMFFLPMILILGNIGIGFSAWVCPEIYNKNTGAISAIVGGLSKQHEFVTCESIDCGASMCTFGNVYLQQETLSDGITYKYLSKNPLYNNEFNITYNFHLNNNIYGENMKDGYSKTNIYFEYSIDVYGLKNNESVKNFIGDANGILLMDGQGWHKNNDQTRMLSFELVDEKYNHQKISHTNIWSIANRNYNSEKQQYDSDYTDFYLQYYFHTSILDKTDGGELKFVLNFTLRGV